MDNSGDGISMQIAVGNGQEIKVIKRFERPNSLGIFYSMLTQFCGFTKDSEEYKLMGLAAYGDKGKYDFSWLIDFQDSALTLRTEYINTVAPRAPSLHKDEMIFNEAFLAKIGIRKRLPDEPIGTLYKDLAASAQSHLETLMLKIADHYLRESGQKRLCTAGGVALNCLSNQRLMNELPIDDLFIQPASTDAGISMGAGWLACTEAGLTPVPPAGTFLGNEYSDVEIKGYWTHVSYDMRKWRMQLRLQQS
jgi:carbamoyltransferase